MHQCSHDLYCLSISSVRVAFSPDGFAPDFRLRYADHQARLGGSFAVFDHKGT